MIKHLLTLAIGSGFLLTGCLPENEKSDAVTQTQQQSETAVTDNRLLGTTWNVEDINERGVIDRANPTMIFEDGRVGGRTGCNNFNASYEAKDGILRIDYAALTRKMCAPALNDQEQKFIAIFNELATYEFNETGALILKTEDGRSLTARSNN